MRMSLLASRAARGLAVTATAATIAVTGAAQADAAVLLQTFATYSNGTACNRDGSWASQNGYVLEFHNGDWWNVKGKGWSCRPAGGGRTSLWFWI